HQFHCEQREQFHRLPRQSISYSLCRPLVRPVKLCCRSASDGNFNIAAGNNFNGGTATNFTASNASNFTDCPSSRLATIVVGRSCGR
ncbi:MAG: hypothetical protein IJ943_01260, partial [Akkermansia sp.]|nr:hypothetical protein [Akkermansia sp.]